MDTVDAAEQFCKVTAGLHRHRDAAWAGSCPSTFSSVLGGVSQFFF